MRQAELIRRLKKAGYTMENRSKHVFVKDQNGRTVGRLQHNPSKEGAIDWIKAELRRNGVKL